MTIEALNSYKSDGSLLPNYGWVQNTSNLSTIREVVEILALKGKHLNHNALMRAILEYRLSKQNIKKKWVWDARCRIKAAVATGMLTIDRTLQGYRLSALGEELINSEKDLTLERGKLKLSNDAIGAFRKGMLTNPPVIRVLRLLNKARKDQHPMSKYDVGGELGFLGDVGFTHFDAEYVANSGYSFNDKEGDSDKWARTLISWLIQVGWAEKTTSKKINGQRLQCYFATEAADKVLRYDAKSATKNIPQEMLCSEHHPFSKPIQKRRAAELKILANRKLRSVASTVTELQALGVALDEETLEYDITNLQRAGIDIVIDNGYIKLADAINLSENEQQYIADDVNKDQTDRDVQHYSRIYEHDIPLALINNLIINVHCNKEKGDSGKAQLFESAVGEFYKFIGFDTTILGQGHGRVADVLVKHPDEARPMKSFAIIVDSKAYDCYKFPLGDVRKMKEYINRHIKELSEEHIIQYAFAFVSWTFTIPNEHLKEIANDTEVHGTAITVPDLLKMGARKVRQEIGPEEIYKMHTTDLLFEPTA